MGIVLLEPCYMDGCLDFLVCLSLMASSEFTDHIGTQHQSHTADLYSVVGSHAWVLQV